MIVGERFEVVCEAGSGGMGVVYEAIDRLTGKRAAVKVLGDRVHSLRFAREADVLSQLEHPAIVGYVAHGDGYLAMEWLEGVDLADRLGEGPLTFEETSALGERIADAMGTAHARGIIHRDLKPSNVFLVEGRADHAKVLDFGLARDASSSASRRPLTATGAVMGSVGYLAPEQARGSAQLDARCDVFALGCILYECLTGVPAFGGGHAVAILAKLLVEDAPRVRTLRPDVPAALDSLVARMLERDPERRPRDGWAVRDALRGDGHSSTRASIRPTALTRDEQRMMAVILVSSGKQAVPDSSTGAPTIVSLSTTDARKALGAVVMPFDASLDVAVDGTLIVALRGGAGVDQVLRAARCSLALRVACPGTVIALALGLGSATPGDVPVAGEVIERAAGLLARARNDTSPGVFVEQHAVPLLESRFVVAPSESGMLLHAERSALTSARVLLGRVTPFVGRARELATLEQAFATAVSEHEATATLVVGEAGSGKSRLREELVAMARRREPSTIVWIAQGDTQRARSPFAVASAVVRAACGIDEGVAPGAQREALGAGLSFDVPRIVSFLAEMIGCSMGETEDAAMRAARDSTQLMNDQITRAWVDFIGARLATAPVLLVLDDLHWTDAPTLQLVDATLAAHRDARLVVVALGRPEALQTYPALWSSHGVQTIQLAPLSPRAAEKLVRQALAEADDRLVARLLERAGGNPFVLEELVRACADHKSDDSLPDGVLALVQARLEGLEPSLRRVLRAASIFGRTAREVGVARLLGDENAIEMVQSALRVLVQREVLETPGDDPSVLRFRHDLVRDAAYAMLTPADRATGHGLAGAWLEEMGEHDAGLLAMHFDKAGQQARAAALYVRAAEQALEGKATAIVDAHASRALELGVTGVARGLALHARAAARHWAADSAKSLEDALAAISDLVPGSAVWMQAVHQACLSGDVVGRREIIADLTKLALGVEPENARARALRVRLLGECAGAFRHMGDARSSDDALEAVEREAAPSMHDPIVAATVLRMRAMRADYAGDSYTELVNWVRIGELFVLMGDRRGCATAHVNIGYGWMMMGMYDRAETSMRQAVQLTRELDMPRALGAARHNLGMILALRGDIPAGLREEMQAVEAMTAARDERLTLAARVYLAMIQEMAGELVSAEATARRALEGIDNLPPAQARAYATVARVLLRAGKTSEAAVFEAKLRNALDRPLAEGGDVYARLVHAELLIAMGRSTEAATEIHDLRQRILAWAARIDDEHVRAAYLGNVPENARVLALVGA